MNRPHSHDAPAGFCSVGCPSRDDKSPPGPHHTTTCPNWRAGTLTPTTQAAHTPGPWAYGDELHSVRERLVTVPATGAHICAVWEMGEDFNTDDAPQRDANARLIAAAPELLAALRACYTALGMVDDFPTASGGEHPDVQNNALDTARAAIAKATGQA